MFSFDEFACLQLVNNNTKLLVEKYVICFVFFHLCLFSMKG